MKKFSFTHLLGGKATAPAAAESKPGAEAAAETQLTATAEAKPGTEAGAEAALAAPAADQSAAITAAVAAAVVGERERCAAIFAAPAAAGNIALAAELAFSTELSAEQAVKILAASPAPTGNRLANAMAALPNPALGAGGIKDGQADAATVTQSWDAATAKANAQFGRGKK